MALADVIQVLIAFILLLVNSPSLGFTMDWEVYVKVMMVTVREAQRLK